MKKAFAKSVLKLRSRVAVLKLAEAIASKNVSKAEAAAGLQDVGESFAPLGGFMRDAFEKGGKTGGRFL
jgi:hypothetical protein